MSNNNDQRRVGQPAHSQGSTEVPSKKDVAAESGKAEAQQLKNEAAGSGRRVKETAKEQAVAALQQKARDLYVYATAIELVGRILSVLSRYPAEGRASSS